MYVCDSEVEKAKIITIIELGEHSVLAKLEMCLIIKILFTAKGCSSQVKIEKPSERK